MLRYVASSVWLDSDPQLLRRVLQNFLANAVRYTLRGRIVIGVRRVGATARIEVWDSGPGIAAADRALIFEEFRRLGHDGQGLGLGLSIADRITRLLGHDLSLRSWPDRGSVFAVEVPTGQPREQAAARTPAARVETPAARVLVVDNDAAVRRAMAGLLDGWGCQVRAAADAAQALEAWADGWPDLLVVDFHLDGGTTGLELREGLPAAARSRPCVVVTADHGEAVRAAVAAAGCQLLYKPLKPLALKSLMARLLPNA